MKLYNVTNISALFNMLDALKEDVKIKTADGTSLNWKSDGNTLRSIAASMHNPKFSELTVHCANSADVENVMEFLMECTRARRAA